MNKPNFFCIGAQKSGTTLLYEHLKNIDDIYLPDIKELHFFDTPDKYEKGIDWYTEAYFKNANSFSKVGEITPSYLFLKEVPKRIYTSLGKDLKFIVMLRNPIQRAYSQYIMRYRKNEEKYSFNDALILELSRTKANGEYMRQYSYAQRGFYVSQIEEYLKYFDKKQFMFILFDEFIINQDLWIEKICKYLNVDKNITIKDKVVHKSQLSLVEKFKFSFLNNIYNVYNILSSKGYPPMNQRTKEILIEYYKNDIICLEKLIDKDLSEWLQ